MLFLEADLWQARMGGHSSFLFEDNKAQLLGIKAWRRIPSCAALSKRSVDCKEILGVLQHHANQDKRAREVPMI